MFNLQSNVIKYTPFSKTPKILVTSIELDEYFVISIKDNGIGLYLKNLNVEEQQLKEWLWVLYMVTRTVTSMGGKITIESEISIGATLSILLKNSNTRGIR